MIIKSATFISSEVDLARYPKPLLPEYAFIGRSNVGKSSLINMLTGLKGLAKISENPGKTRTINHFRINDAWYLVDLPGYGFARTSKNTRDSWEKMISQYLSGRYNLMNVFLLIDSRLSPQASDLTMANRLGSMNLPFTIIFTKSDKISSTILEQNTTKFKKSMEDNWEEVPPSIITSSKTGIGKDLILKSIEKTNPLFKPDSALELIKKTGKF